RRTRSTRLRGPAIGTFGIGRGRRSRRTAAIQSLCRLRTAKDFRCRLLARSGQCDLALGAYRRQRSGGLMFRQCLARADQPCRKLSLDSLADGGAMLMHLLSNRVEDLTEFRSLAARIV